MTHGMPSPPNAGRTQTRVTCTKRGNILYGCSGRRLGETRRRAIRHPAASFRTSS
jgi:hypothetical protein